MNISEEITACMQALLDNEADECKWNDKLLQQSDFDGFKELVIQRSQVIRRYFEENEKLIGKLKKYGEMPMDHDVAEGLFEASRRIILQGRMDPVLVTIVTKPIVDYYISKGEEERAICAVLFYNSCCQDYFSRVDHRIHKEELVNYYQWVVDRAGKYCSYTDIRARRNIIAAYTNYIFLLCMSDDPADYEKIMELLQSLQDMWTSEEVQALDGNNPSVKLYFTTQLYYLLCEMNDYCRSMDDGIRNSVVASMKRFCAANRDDENWQKTVKFLNIQIENHERHRKSDDATEQWGKLLDEFETPDWIGNEERAQEIFQLASDTILWAMAAVDRSKNMTEQEKEKYTTDILHKYERFLINLPYAHWGSYVNDVFKQILVKSLPNVKSMRHKEQIFDQLLIRRQPSTYLHTRMVEEISETIAREIIHTEPELFLTLPYYRTVEEVVADTDRLLDIIARGARLHDAGKSSIASVIMQQSRRLTDDEIMLIRSHPEIGYRLFEGTEEFDVYADIIRGHHKTYDGKGGYPADFNNTASPYRVLIDLITISDSTDAATDILGRNYAQGKDFTRLLQELKEGAGSKYNPDIVRIMAASPSLIAELTELTGSRRLIYSYEAYSQCLKYIISE